MKKYLLNLKEIPLIKNAYSEKIFFDFSLVNVENYEFMVEHNQKFFLNLNFKFFKNIKTKEGFVPVEIVFPKGEIKNHIPFSISYEEVEYANIPDKRVAYDGVEIWSNNSDGIVALTIQEKAPVQFMP